MSKDMKESIWAILIIIAVFLSGYFAGDSFGYTRGLSEGWQYQKEINGIAPIATQLDS